jgi:hypothetical protein
MFGLILSVAALAGSSPTAAVAQRPSVAIVWHIRSAPFADASVRAAAATLDVPAEIGPIVRALRAHPLARFALAMDADVSASLERTRAGQTALSDAVGGRLSAGDARTTDLLRVLADVPVGDERLNAAPAFRRYAQLASTARRALGGENVHLRAGDLVELGGFAALSRLALLGAVPPESSLLKKSALTSQDAVSLVAQLARADADGLDVLRALAASGQLENIADPAGEPLLPLLVDNGGKTSLDPNFVQLGAQADAEYLVMAALRAARGASPQGGTVGIYSPHGAYDDKTAAVFATHGAAYALFSDRVLGSTPAGGSLAAVNAADTAAFHSYVIQATSTRALPALFWNEDEGISLSSLSPNSPRTAMGERIAVFARAAGQLMGGAAAVALLRIDADSGWSQRADRASVVDEIANVLSRENVDMLTPGQYVRSGRAQTTVYGFAPASDEGPISTWTSDANQLAMWSGLADARKAAGGDSALGGDATRVPLLTAEASHWYAMATLAQPSADLNAELDAFRKLIAQVYRGAARTPPPNIAPFRSPSPPPTTKPLPSPSPSR